MGCSKWLKILIFFAFFLLLLLGEPGVIVLSQAGCYREQRYPESGDDPGEFIPGEFVKVRWPIARIREIPFQIDSSVPQEWHTAIRLAAASWNIALRTAGVNLKFKLTPDPGSPNVIRVLYDPEKKNKYIGLTLVNASLSNNGVFLIDKVETVFNTAWEFTTKNERGKFDVQGIATHEFGHWLGLGDLTGEIEVLRCRNRSVMIHLTILLGLLSKFDRNRLSLRLRFPKTDDIEGLKTFYPNRPPIANAGLDQTVLVGSTVQLDGSASSDPDGDPLSFYWRFLSKPRGSRARLSISGIPNPTFIADKEGEYILELRVRDGRGRPWVSDQVRITASKDVTPPTLIMDFQASDGEDSKSTLTWTNPSDSDLYQVIVKRKTTGYPTNHDDGETRLTIDSATPGRAEIFVDTGLTNGITYYYAVFSRDKAGNWNDQVVEGKNADTGRPEAVPTIELYAGTSNPGKVYSYRGGTQWEAISEELGFAVLSLIKHNGALYAGTMSGTDLSSIGRLYRYDGGITWTLVCDNLDHQVSSLVIYKGNLYIGTSWNGGRLYRFDGPGNCTLVVDHSDPGGWRGFRSAYVWGDYLYLGDIGYDIIGRFDGTAFEHIVYLGGSCIYDFALYNNELYAGAWRGSLYRSSNGTDWTQVFGESHHLWELEVFRGKLFMGFDSGELQRSDGTNRETIWTAPDGIISMIAKRDDRLYIGTGGEAGYSMETSGDGKVYAYDGSTVFPISGYLGAGVQVLYLAPATSGPSAASTGTQRVSFNAIAFQRADDIIEFRTRESGLEWMQINIFDLAGRLIFRTDWVENGFKWNLFDDQGQKIANGVYLYVIIVRGYDGTTLRSEVKKLIVLR